MTRSLLPPETDRELSKGKRRTSDLERKLAKKIPAIHGPIVPFSLSGAVYVTSSGRWVHPYGGNLILLVATLLVPGETDTVIEALKNGSPIGEPLTIEADGDFARTKIPDVAFSALFDGLQIAVTDAGTEASELVVLAVFDA